MEGRSSPNPVADLMDFSKPSLPVANGGGALSKSPVHAAAATSTPLSQEQSPTNESRLSRILCRSLKERILNRSMEERRDSADQDEQPALVEMKQPSRELPRRQQPHRAAAVKGRNALMAAEKGKAVVMSTVSPRPNKKKRTTETHNGAPRKLELPKIRFEMTKEEIEKDFMKMTGGKLPCPKKHPKPIENKIKLITPGAYLPDVTMGRYAVRIRKCKEEKQRKVAGLKGMMDDSSNDFN